MGAVSRSQGAHCTSAESSMPPPPPLTCGHFLFPYSVNPEQAPAKTAHATVKGAGGAPEFAVGSPMARCRVYVNKTPPTRAGLGMPFIQE